MIRDLGGHIEAYSATSTIMMPFTRALFWDCDPESLDVRKHRKFIIARVLNRGRTADWRSLRRLYSDEELRHEVVGIRDLTPKALAFCSTYFQIPKETFRCSTKTPSLSLTPGRS